jgi:hypothetical protein
VDIGTRDFNPVTEFLVPFAISDAALFHSLMCFSSSLVDARVGRDTSGPTTLYHMGNAITMINDALNDTQRAVSDAVLATICLVAANNVSIAEVLEVNKLLSIGKAYLQRLSHARTACRWHRSDRIAAWRYTKPSSCRLWLGDLVSLRLLANNFADANTGLINSVVSILAHSLDIHYPLAHQPLLPSLKSSRRSKFRPQADSGLYPLTSTAIASR